MPNPLMALAVGGTQVASGALQYGAAKKASSQQASAAGLGIEEQRRQFDALQELLKPYVQAGTPALQGQQNLIGLGAPGAQQTAIQQIAQGPQFGAMLQQGENAMLQNASATGGLRGGNLQGALAQFRPQLLSQLIDQQYQRLGGLSTMGQNAAAMQGTAGQNMANQVTGLYGDIGAAQAGGSLGRANAIGGVLNSIPQMAGMFAGFGGSAPAVPSGGFGGGFSGAMQPGQMGGFQQPQIMARPW